MFGTVSFCLKIWTLFEKFDFHSGTLDFVLIWSILNFTGITMEGIARAVGRTQRYQYVIGHLDHHDHHLLKVARV